MSEKNFDPNIVGFLCKWCTYSGADLAGTSRMQYPSSIIPIRVMCSSRVDPIFLIASYLRGADGVFIGGCHPGDCHYQQGNYYTRRRFALLKSLFEALGMEVGRIKLSWISASEGAKFARTVTDYTEYVKKLGPNPVRKEIFL